MPRMHSAPHEADRRRGLRRAFLAFQDSRSLTRPPLPPPTNSTSVMCSAAKPAFVEKVEKAGKAAIAGLAASAVIASVR